MGGRPPGDPAPGVGALAADLNDELDQQLAAADARWVAHYPGDAGSRQPVHTVYVPADRFTAETPRQWGDQALELLDRLAPDALTLSRLTGLGATQVAEVHDRVLAKLVREPIEDLRVDFEDGYGHRSDAAEDADVGSACAALDSLAGAGGRPPFFGIRFKSFEAPSRHRGVQTLTRFLASMTAAGGVPDGLIVTLPKVTSVDQVVAMVHVCDRLEAELRLPSRSLRFEIQIETAQSIVASDGTAAVAAMVHAAEGRCSGLHFGTFDYSAGLGITAAYQSLDHPAADHAKAVMQVAAAQTGVRLSDGSTNVVAFGDADAARASWTLHARLVTRALERGYYQGWDMHPGHLPTRYLANYVFFRAAMAPAAERLKRYVQQAAGAEHADGAKREAARPESAGPAGVMDEPATARALATALLRGVRCGAIDDDEVLAASGLSSTALLALSGQTQHEEQS